ncbi:hypothetical protein JKA74_17320 [Marivirga sp. S37H4]|uniref:DUF5683 domain-containing protein n=1 Tax=Marivirga aurantiaca TaxID=2802615 RepID=A0A934X1K7_9BACT|nr:hypothetical protein [Marivirga aurantiaca]MBK6266807.1 hypothetical protein [Marivirga aurantiaca]
MIIGFRGSLPIVVLAVLLLLNHNSIGQKSENDFINYLYSSHQHQHLIDYLKHIKKDDDIGINRDTTNFLIGKSYYYLQEHEKSNKYLSKVSISSSPYLQSQFLININAIYSNDFKSGFNVLHELKSEDSIINDLKSFELSGLALLNRNVPLYEEYDYDISKDYYFLSNERATLKTVADDLREKKLKSPWVAGIATAIIPGAGKFYAGKRGQGIYSFVISTFLALQVWESYNKDGIESPRFIIYGSLFSLFHAGNIWSSALTVKNYNNEYNEAVNYRIKMDMHIPIRTFFN